MKNQIIFLIFAISFLSFVSAIQQPLIYYKLNLDYSYGNISINSTQVEFSDEPIDNVFGFYSVSIFDSDGKILNLTLFDVPNEILYDTVDENGTINGGGFLELNQTNFDIFVPYNSNAKDVVVYDENLTELIRKDVSEFSRIKATDFNKTITKTTSETIQTRPTEIKLMDKLSNYWWVLVAFLIILVACLFYSLNKKK